MAMVTVPADGNVMDERVPPKLNPFPPVPVICANVPELVMVEAGMFKTRVLLLDTDPEDGDPQEIPTRLYPICTVPEPPGFVA